VKRRAASLRKEEADTRRSGADDDGVGVGKTATVDIDGEVTGSQPGERSAHAAREFVVRRARADRFPNCKRKKVAHAQRRCECKGARAADCDGMEVERNLYADHQTIIFCRIEELPAG
jgi:sRNA-binding protein